MNNFTMDYQQVADLGFKRFDYEDSVVFRENGQHPFLMQKKLDKRVKIEWYSDDHTLKIWNIHRRTDGVVGWMEIESASELRRLIKLFSGKNIEEVSHE